MFRLKENEVPFGELCGVAPGNVPAYSNGSDWFFSAERSIVNGLNCGFKYQCVEYARRWLLKRKGLLLRDVPWASHIFERHEVDDATTGEAVPMVAVHNNTTAFPAVDSLLIYPSSDDFPPGHIAAIVEVGDTWVRIADQNSSFHKWGDKSYSEEIPVVRNPDGTFTMRDHDGHIPLGWMTFPTRTESRPLDATDPEIHPKFLEPLEETYDLQRVTFVPKPERHDWLDATIPYEKKFIDTFGLDANRSRLSEDEANYYTMNTDLWLACCRAGTQCHKMCLDATARVLKDDALLSKFGIPEELWPRLKRSFERCPYALTGRFDFAVDESGKMLKMFEYNADSASTLLECGVVQEKWAQNVGVAAENTRSSGGRLQSLLGHAWRELVAAHVVAAKSKVHFLVDDDNEEMYTGLFVASGAEEAGLTTELCVMFDMFTWQGGHIVDKDGVRVTTVWKTWAWESAISDMQAALKERGPGWVPKDGDKVRLCDVLLGPDEEIVVMEPMWKLVPSNKAILPILWEMNPGHEHLLRTEWTLSPELQQGIGYVKKPIVGRCGKNVTIMDTRGEELGASEGQFADRDMVYQELFPLPKRDDYYAILGGWMVGACYGGTGLREDKTIITNVESPFSAIRVKLNFDRKPVTQDSVDKKKERHHAEDDE